MAGPTISVKTTIVPLVLGVVLVFVGATSANIAGGIGQYIVGTLNTSLGGSITINLYNSNFINLMSTVFTMIGIALIVYAVAVMISALFESMKPISTSAGNVSA